MKPPVKSTDRFGAGRQAPAPGVRRPAAPALLNRAAPNVGPQAAAPQQPVRNAVQARGAPPPAAANKPTPRAANYTVQAPIHMGRSQQIRATIQGTPQVAGSVELSSAGPGKAYISNLTVDQQHRRHGVAAKLIDAAINTARRQGFSVASLEARPSDNGIAPQNLVAMYRRRGFKSVGKTGRGSPLMERKL